MGERNNIYITGLSALSALDEAQIPPRYYIYGHWAGGGMHKVAADALINARDRYGDESYWLRMFLHHAFETLTEPNGISCGFGIGHPDDQDGYWHPVEVSYSTQTIRCGRVDYKWQWLYDDYDNVLEVLKRAEYGYEGVPA